MWSLYACEDWGLGGHYRQKSAEPSADGGWNWNISVWNCAVTDLKYHRASCHFCFLDCVPVPVSTLSHITLQHVSISGVPGNTPVLFNCLVSFFLFCTCQKETGSWFRIAAVWSERDSCVYSLWLTFCKHCFMKYKASWAPLYLHCWCGLNTPSNNLEELVLLFGISRINGA